MAPLRGALPLLAVLTAAAAAAGCELVMDDLPSAHTPSASLDATADSMDSGADALEELLEEPGPEEQEASAEEPTSCPCDCDNDGHLKDACGGDDCDDEDGDVYTGQVQYFDVESLHHQYDYDCDNQFDPDPAWNVLVNCAGLSLVYCDDKLQGYLKQIPACGQPGVWAKCFKNGAFCDAQVLYDAKKLPCK